MSTYWHVTYFLQEKKTAETWNNHQLCTPKHRTSTCHQPSQPINVTYNIYQDNTCLRQPITITATSLHLANGVSEQDMEANTAGQLAREQVQPTRQQATQTSQMGADATERSTVYRSAVGSRTSIVERLLGDGSPWDEEDEPFIVAEDVDMDRIPVADPRVIRSRPIRTDSASKSSSS